MERTLLAFPIIALALLLSACVEDPDTPEACRYEALRALDNGNWDRALELLSQRNCIAGFSTEERRMNIAAAHIGKAGYDLPDIISFLIRYSDLYAEDTQPDPWRVLQAFRELLPDWDTLDHVSSAQLHYSDMMLAFPDRLWGACTPEQHSNLSRLQKNACINNGVLAAVKGIGSILLLLRDEVDTWLDEGITLDCRNDRNRSGTLDQAEIAACALHAAASPDQPGQCPSAREGTVSWKPVAGHASVSFFDAGTVAAELMPIEVQVANHGECAAPRNSHRLLKRQGDAAALALSLGFCSTARVRGGCDGSDPDADCWPCPLLQPQRKGVFTVSDSVLDSLNRDVENFYRLREGDELERARAKLDALRTDICTREGEAICAQSTDGTLQIDETALADYLLRPR